jgi:hypothetical protein
MENFDVDLSNRPIVVGYAFGAKKMRSMGMVMAEASKAQFYPPIHELEEDHDDFKEEADEDIVVIDLEKKQKLHQVVRHFQQSCCSSMDGGDANSSAGGLTTTTISDHHSGLTVSFVPLDPGMCAACVRAFVLVGRNKTNLENDGLLSQTYRSKSSTAAKST